MQPIQATKKAIALLPFLISVFFLCGAVLLLWPYFQYYIDLDAISYLTLVKDYLDGNFYQAVNAFWSPMGCWLTVLWVKYTGWELFAAAISVNTIGAIGALWSSQVLFNKFRTNSFERWCFAITMSFFLTYVVYIQSFTDVWQCFFLLLGLLILLRTDFEQKPFLWTLVGCIGALAYFSKSYSFYFFPFMIILISGLKMAYHHNYKIKKHLFISLSAIAVMLLIAFPWIYLLHTKYGIWTFSTAGSLNLSWWLEGSFHPKEGIATLLPPPYKNSLFYFEDPFLVQGNIAHFWDSPVLFLKLFMRVGYNALQWVISSNNLSSFYFFIWLFGVISIFLKKNFFINSNTRILIYIFLFFPLPYWLLTFDHGRYLWFTVPLSIIIGMLIFNRLLFPYFNNVVKKIFLVIFFLTFLVQPLLWIKDNFKKGTEEYRIAQQMKKLDIKGSFVSNLSYSNGKEKLHLIAWFTQSPWYCHPLNIYSNHEILKDAKRYHVKYYFYFYEGAVADYQLKNKNGKYFKEVTQGTIPGLKVFYLGI